MLYPPQCPKHDFEAVSIIGPEIHVLQRPQSEGNPAIFIENRNDSLQFIESEVDFILDMVGVDGSWGQDDQHSGRVLQSLLNGARPALARSDVQLVQPDIDASGLQIFGQP